jgi:2-polyprenyl-3-methyl-5-hydroxy-6-metoxy-1,4-benzoquinol methylase
MLKAFRSLILSKKLQMLGDYYHSFDSLGLYITQREENYFRVNQKCKEGTILAYSQLAVEKSKGSCKDKPSVLELFCADGYYAAHAKRMGAGLVNGIDLDERSIKQANAVFQALFGESNRFHVADVHSFVPATPYDIVLCCGGLYHVSDPRRVIQDCYSKLSRKYLIVQSVVSLENESGGYFITPAPGWKHGSRFSTTFLREMILQVGWQIIDDHFNQLEGNTRLCDRGSAYFFCQK